MEKWKHRLPGPDMPQSSWLRSTAGLVNHCRPSQGYKLCHAGKEDFFPLPKVMKFLRVFPDRAQDRGACQTPRPERALRPEPKLHFKSALISLRGKNRKPKTKPQTCPLLENNPFLIFPLFSGRGQTAIYLLLILHARRKDSPPWNCTSWLDSEVNCVIPYEQKCSGWANSVYSLPCSVNFSLFYCFLVAVIIFPLKETAPRALHTFCLSERITV